MPFAHFGVKYATMMLGGFRIELVFIIELAIDKLQPFYHYKNLSRRSNMYFT
jgi:hypothetical protein